MTKAWLWLKKWGGALFGALAGLLLAILTLGWYVRRKDAEIAGLKDDKAVAEAVSEVRRLESLKEEVAARVDEKDEAIVRLDEQIRDQKRRVVGAANAGEELTDEELEAAFKRALGG